MKRVLVYEAVTGQLCPGLPTFSLVAASLVALGKPVKSCKRGPWDAWLPTDQHSLLVVLREEP